MYSGFVSQPTSKSKWVGEADNNFPAIASFNSKIFAMGGRAPENTVGRLNSVEVYDVKTNQWTAGKPLVRLNLSFAPYIEV